MPTKTPILGLYKPLVNNATDQDLWGGYLNDDMDILDAQPYGGYVGEIKLCSSTTPFTGTLACDGSLVSRTTYANLWTFVQSSGNLSATDTTAISAGYISNPGSAYTAGTYPGVSLTGGIGTGAIATITVAGGIITTVNITSGGTGYAVGNTLSASNTGIGGTGSGFALIITAVTGWNKGMYSPGDGSTTFRLPDLRGQFIRAFDGSGLIDPSRTFGSAQIDTFQTHTHTLTDPGHFHTSSFNSPLLSGGGISSAGPATGGFNKDTDVKVTGITVTTPNSGNAATETRPKNIAYLYVVKY